LRRCRSTGFDGGAGWQQHSRAAQAHELMEHMEDYEGGRWVPYFALCLFAGIRPSEPDGEITKLKPEAVDLDAGVISVSAESLEGP